MRSQKAASANCQDLCLVILVTGSSGGWAKLSFRSYQPSRPLGSLSPPAMTPRPFLYSESGTWPSLRTFTSTIPLTVCPHSSCYSVLLSFSDWLIASAPPGAKLTDKRGCGCGCWDWTSVHGQSSNLRCWAVSPDRVALFLVWVFTLHSVSRCVLVWCTFSLYISPSNRLLGYPISSLSAKWA